MAKIKVDELCAHGIKYKLINESPSAVKYFWQALACGNMKSAFELSAIFKEGNNIEKNAKAEEAFKKVGELLLKIIEDVKWQKARLKLENSDKVVDKLSYISRKALEDFKGEVTEETIKDQVYYCNQVIAQKFGDNYHTMHELANAMPVSTLGAESYGSYCVIL